MSSKGPLNCLHEVLDPASFTLVTWLLQLGAARSAKWIAYSSLYMIHSTSVLTPQRTHYNFSVFTFSSHSAAAGTSDPLETDKAFN